MGNFTTIVFSPLIANSLILKTSLVILGGTLNLNYNQAIVHFSTQSSAEEER